LITSISLLSNPAQREPGFIIGPIATVLGVIVDAIYNALDFLGIGNTLGLTIIILTIITMLIMLPLAFMSQKSMRAMQKLQPEIEKINAKYDSKDKEAQKLKYSETQTLYAKHKVTPFGGCFPMLIQLPIFFALNYLMNNSERYISKIRLDFEAIPNFVANILPDHINDFAAVASPKLAFNSHLDLSVMDNLKNVLNMFTKQDFSEFTAKLPTDLGQQLQMLLDKKQNIQTFLGINLAEGIKIDIFARFREFGASGIFAIIQDIFVFPAILIPILVAITTFYSSYSMNKSSASPNATNAAMQRQMLIIMPIIMFFMTFSLPGGVGLYWITSSFFRAAQQPLINRYYIYKENKDSSIKLLKN
jgi:YidC/Oxa1 family membrane protein insertase